MLFAAIELLMVPIGQEFHVFKDTYAYYHVYKGPKLILALRQIYPSHVLPYCCFKIHNNIIHVCLVFQSSLFLYVIQ